MNIYTILIFKAKLKQIKYLFLISFLFLSLFCLSQGSENCLKFNGINEFIDIGDAAANGVRTIEIWFKLDITIDNTLNNVQTLIARDYNNGDPLSINEFSICFSHTLWGNAGKIQFVRCVNSVRYSIYSDSNYWQAGIWYHLTATINPVDGMKLYINGVLQQNLDSSIEPIETMGGSIWDKVSIARWGNWNNINARYFTGEIDEVRLWNISRSESEIREFMCRKLTGNEPGLKAYWKFDNSSGNILYDLTPNNYDGILQNMTNANWITSGAPIGDTSTYIYPANWTGQILSLLYSAGDEFIISLINSISKGAHIYRVNSLPNTTNGIASIGNINSYYGVFLTNIIASYDISYDYSFFTSDCNDCNILYSRNDNSINIWTGITADYDSCIASKSNESSVGSNFRAEYFLSPILINFNLGNDTILCQGESLLLDATTESATYLWQDVSINPTFNVTSDGVYWVAVTVNGCSGSDTIVVNYIPLPSVNLGNDTILCQGESLLLDATTDNATYLWQDSSSNSFFIVTSQDTYYVEVKNQCGISKDSIFVAFEDCECYLYIPNAFTPNNDGLNDIFNIESQCRFIEFNLKIYNRWGELIFETKDEDKGWNGKYKNKTCQNGVYVWLLNYKAKINHKIIKKQKCGIVTLVK